MAIRKIAQLGHPVLRQRAREVDRDELASAATQRFIDDLIETMRDASGAGLAAIQVYEPVRICAIEVGDNPRYPYKPRIPLTVLVNPVLTPVGDERFDNYEGCLSVPNLRGVVSRATHLHVRAWDRDGNEIVHCHTLNNTVVASPRILIPLLELNQQPDGSVRVPAGLQPYLGTDVIPLA